VRVRRARDCRGVRRGLFDLSDADFAPRLDAVRRALYLLFNEGYHGASAETAVRAELCAEALRLVRLLREYAAADTPETAALAALMCLHGARLPARLDEAGELSRLFDQDRARWDTALVSEGLALLEASATGSQLTAYHVEAAIAAAHASAATPADTDWPAIVALYDRLMTVAPSPVVALNRAVALGWRDGPAAGLAALDAIEDRDRLARYPFYEAAGGELELQRGHREAARVHFEAARRVARNPTERRHLDRRIAAAGGPAASGTPRAVRRKGIVRSAARRTSKG
jgi:predicted RNA polymerase sigma factor